VKFNVVAQSQHIGDSLGSGHYIAQVRPKYLEDSGVWLEIDDDKVKAITRPSAGNMIWLKNKNCTDDLYKQNKALAGNFEMRTLVEKTSREVQCHFF
jgi:hypothetical protein